MAELEAITDVQADPKKSAVMARQYGRRFPLAPNKPLNLGRDEGKMDIAVPEDDQISRFQAILTWEPGKEKLTVQTRPTSPGYPNPPANQTLVFDDKLKKLIEAPLGKCVVGRGESFWIGQTRFTLHSEDESELESPVDATVAPRQEEKTRAQLEEIPFANPAAALRDGEPAQHHPRHHHRASAVPADVAHRHGRDAAGRRRGDRAASRPTARRPRRSSTCWNTTSARTRRTRRAGSFRRSGSRTAPSRSGDGAACTAGRPTRAAAPRPN